MQVCVATILVSRLVLVLLLLQGCCAAAKDWTVRNNDATEVLPEYRGNSRTPQVMTRGSNSGSNNHTLNNRAKNGGRTANTISYSASELSCRELRSTRYITDGSCRSAKPVRELVCSGQCMPSHLLPNSIMRGKWWRSNASEYRCIPAHSRTKRIQLHCPNTGNTRTYKIRVVTSCKCKRFRPHHNQSEAKEVPTTQRSRKHRRLSQQDRSKNNTPLIDNMY